MPDSNFSFFDDDGRLNRASGTATATDLPEAPEETPPKKRMTGSRKALLVMLISFLVIALGVGAVVGFYFSRVDKALGNFQQETLLPAPYEGQPQVVPGSNAQNFLIIGADKNDNGSDGRSDVLMIAHLSGDRKNIYLVSFPRDLWVDVPANRYVSQQAKAKINAAYSWGRTPLAVQTVEILTGVRINHSAEINFGGFMGLTETLGGVTVNNKHASTVREHTFPAGEITIQGEEALAYVRQRYGLPNGDLDRAERQRAVLSAILDKGMSPEVLTNPIKFGEMVDLASQQVVVDQTLPSSEVKALIYGLGIRERGQVHSLQAPITGFGTSHDGQSIAIPNEPKLAELSAALREDKMTEYMAKYPKG